MLYEYCKYSPIKLLPYSIPTPQVYDSEGVMRGLLPQGNLMWVPLSDLKVGKRNLSDTYWVVSASDDAIKCVLCKGKSRDTLKLETYTVNVHLRKFPS